MKEIINYYYNFDIYDVKEYDSYVSFLNNNDLFYFVYYNKSVDELKQIMFIIQELKRKGVFVHDILLNRNNEIVTKIDNYNYVCLKINGNKNEVISFMDMINNLNKNRINNKLYINNWATLWSSKIDYYEYQINELGKDKRIVLDSFSYYIGLCENAIAYVNKINKVIGISENDIVSLSHKRIFYPNTLLNYNNPLSFIIDLNVRDVAEYLKINFFNKDNVYMDLSIYLKSVKLTKYSYHMLYARLLYPSIYFDYLDEIMNNKCNEDKLLNIISMQDEYEKFLLYAYNEINKYTNLERVDWLIKKEL